MYVLCSWSEIVRTFKMTVKMSVHLRIKKPSNKSQKKWYKQKHPRTYVHGDGNHGEMQPAADTKCAAKYCYCSTKFLHTHATYSRIMCVCLTLVLKIMSHKTSCIPKSKLGDPYDIHIMNRLYVNAKDQFGKHRITREFMSHNNLSDYPSTSKDNV